ncbi:MAG: cytochrome c [Gammaproteobacteria bacterium]|nr:cytochrome c [Gammaproteobacteria bacterium]
MKQTVWVVVGLGLWVCACSRDPTPTSSESSTVLTVGDMKSLASLDGGAQLYLEHCAQCHGPEAEGHPDWQTPGVVAAPPLNGTGNDWKRSRAQLMASVRDGMKRDGELVMPVWNGRLTDAQIADVIAWCQTLWPPEVYAQWQKTAAGGG